MADPPLGEHRLDAASARMLPASPGLYAAWITTDEALEEIGIDQPSPCLVYVGIAIGRGGLKHRLSRHATVAWWELIDLLAARRTVLPAWWAHGPKNTARRSLSIPALAKVSHSEGLAWQQKHLAWGWTTGTRTEIRADEIAVIASHRPLINRNGRGYKAELPAQLRAAGYERERAWWLFHTSWLAVMTLQPSAFTRRSLASTLVATDTSGWPVPLSDGSSHKLRIPTERRAARLLTSVAPTELRPAMPNHTASHQARAWWAAYIGHEFLPNGVPVDEALGAALRRGDEGYRSPPQLPDSALRDQLVALVKQLPYVAH